MSSIRVSYSGLFSFFLSILTTVIGMLFVLLMTRNLSVLEYGSWGLILSITVYAAVIEPIISIWVLRETARDIHSSKTAILSGCVFSIIGVSIYLISGYFIVENTDAEFETIMYGALLIPGIFINRILTAINSGWKPEVTSFAQLFFVITEVIVIFIFIYIHYFGIFEVILSVLIAYVVSISIQLFFAKNHLKYPFEKKFLKNWLKHFWLPLYPTIGNSIIFFDVAIFAILYGSVMGIAYWTAAFMVASVILITQTIFRPIYSKLLSGANITYLNENMRQFFYFSLPLIALIIVFAKPAMFILNPDYSFAFPIVVILVIQIFLSLLNRYFQEILMGIEKVDMYENSTTNYIKSHLFLMPSLQIIKNIFYVIILVIVISIMLDSSSLLELLIYWALISTLSQIPFIVYTFLLMKKHITIKLDFTRILSYIITCAVVFGIVYFAINFNLQYENQLLDFVSNLIPYLIFGFGGYFGITLIYDSRSRILFRSIINEFKMKL